METFWQDARYALAMMRRSKGFTTAGLLTLALGIGATSAVFSVVYGVLLRPLPYPSAERLVRLSEEHAGANSPLRAPMLSNLTYHAWADARRTVEQFAAYRNEQYTVTVGGESSRLEGARLTPSMLPLLGETPALRRFFAADEGAEGNDAVVVLSHRGWRERFNSDRWHDPRAPVPRDARLPRGARIAAARGAFVHRHRLCHRYSPVDRQRGIRAAVSYGVLSYVVSQRRRELGVRAALGASRTSLVALVIREGLAVAGIGLAAGLAGAALLTRLLQSVLFGVTPLDPASFLAGPIVLIPVALVACAIPALRAASTEPAEALRCE